MRVAKLLIGTIAALVVFALGELPLLFVPPDPQAPSQVRPDFLGFESVVSSIVLSGLCLLCPQARRPLLQGAGVGILAGILISLPDQADLYKDSLKDAALFIPVLMTVELWHFLVWGVAGAAVTWVQEGANRWSAA